MNAPISSAEHSQAAPVPAPSVAASAQSAPFFLNEGFPTWLQQIPAGIIIAEAGTERIAFANDETVRIFRQEFRNPDGSADGITWTLLREDGSELPLEEYSLVRALRQGVTITGKEQRIRRGDGSVAIVSVNAAPIRDLQGRIIAAVLTLFDITERKRVEKELAETLVREQAARGEAERNRAQFRALFESIPGLLLVLTPQSLRIFAASDAYLQATNTKREQILGRPVFEVFPPDPEDPTSEKSVAMARASMERVKQTGKPDLLAVQRYTVRRSPEQDGGFEERYWTVANYPVFGPGHVLAYIIHRVEDVTEYVQLKRREGSWQEDVFTIQNMEQRMEAEVVTRTEELHRVNERLRQREEQLQSVNNELSDFATIVSHDLKAPLRAVATLARWTQIDASDKLDAEGRNNLNEIIQRVHRMNQMIEGLLRYARIGGADEKHEAVPLAPLLREVWKELAPPENAGIRLQENLPALPGDPLRLRQLFQNLLGNALKYSDKPNVLIQVRVQENESYWQIEVADNGPGIEEKHWERIFKIFQTLAPKDHTDSTGVGLALVKRIVEKTGGHVWLRSTLGVGSSFFFTWPKLPLDSEPGGEQHPLQSKRS